ncbi:hypothetical protein SNE40_012825 [Patella caerulea]|uniref:Nanos-type domain-containing protein n=1 Tax=Patella caerulea TaxID=87958 RepID=A0AAN8PFY3_PATCE
MDMYTQNQMKTDMFLDHFISCRDVNKSQSPYTPFADYFGLSSLINGSHSPVDSTESLSPYSEPETSFGLGHFTCNVAPVLDPLEELRCDAHNDFLKNGIECDLDEWDKCQARLRGQNLTDRVPLTVEFEGNDKVFEYMLVKERKKAKSMKPMKPGQTGTCVFCKNNGEPVTVYSSHLLKDDSGKVTCPILWRYTCPLCGITGDNAHTIKYCPLNNGEYTSTALLKTARLCNGKRRREVPNKTKIPA